MERGPPVAHPCYSGWGKCECGVWNANAHHLVVCPLLPIECRKEDFMTTAAITDKVIQITAYREWKGREANIKLKTKTKRRTYNSIAVRFQ